MPDSSRNNIFKNMPEQYTKEEKKQLLQTARIAIEKYLATGETYQPEFDNKKFQEKRGVFVTLKKAGNLRGCVGYIEPIKSLVEAVSDNAISAAFYDDRFLPITGAELDDIEIEISVLTIPVEDTLENIINDKSGVILKCKNNSATYLPQVWQDINNKEEFFSSLCLKAGLAPNCYQDSETKLLSYRAIVFGE